MRSRVYEKGLGVHAYSSLTYKLGGQFERFVATVGIDDAAGEHGSVVFHVLLDGKPAFESAVLRGTDAPVSVSVDVSSAAMLTLECDDANDLDLADHADWADAALIRAKTSAVR